MQTHRKPPFSGHLFILLLSSLFLSKTVTSVLVLSQDDLKDGPIDDSPEDPNSVADWDEFGESDSRSDDELDPGSWRPVFEPDDSNSDPDTVTNPQLKEYYSSVAKLVDAVSDGDRSVKDVASEIESFAATGNHHVQSF